MPIKKSSPPVELDEALAAEYNYIVQTATQANEDRARIASFYLIAVGSLVAAILGTQFLDPQSISPTIKFLFSGLFVLLTLMGTSTVVQLARLRAAWHESMLAMNQIKDFMMSQNTELKHAFRWTSATLPAKYKTDSISYFQAREAAVISGITFGAAMFFAQFAITSPTIVTWIVSAGAGSFIAFLQLSLYKRILN
jgi:predicted branched-subunit amino acid permease